MSQVSFHPDTQSKFIDQLEQAFHRGDATSAHKAEEVRNVQRLVEQYRSIARGDFAAVLDSWDDEIDYEIHGPAGSLLVGYWHGKNNVAAAVARNFGALQDQEAEVISLVAQGDTIVILARERGKVRATGKPYNCHWVQFFTFADDKLKRFRALIDTTSINDSPN
jgi:ketosteroid isomerase-like protein